MKRKDKIMGMSKEEQDEVEVHYQSGWWIMPVVAIGLASCIILLLIVAAML